MPAPNHIHDFWGQPQVVGHFQRSHACVSCKALVLVSVQKPQPIDWGTPDVVRSFPTLAEMRLEAKAYRTPSYIGGETRGS